MEKILSEKNSIFERQNMFGKVKTDGPYKMGLYKKMQSSWDSDNLNNVFINAINGFTKFSPINKNSEKMKRVLCLGKVQSGKTAFFIASIALAFDNGYDIAYVIGGTKNNLLSQNKDRVIKEFDGIDEELLIMDINNSDVKEIRKVIESGCKVILMVLKHKSNTSDNNLSKLEELTSGLSDIPSLIVDDEGDEFTPGNIKGTAKASNSILDSINHIKNGTYLSVTATPQAPLLLSTLNELSPDDCILIKPGNGYTGANTFHDTAINQLVKDAYDSDQFKTGIPNTFKESLRFFLIGSAIRVLRGDKGDHSMLIHPSSFTAVHSIITSKVEHEVTYLQDSLSDEKSFNFESVKEDFRHFYDSIKNEIENSPDFDIVFSQLINNLKKVKIWQVNRTQNDTEDEGMSKFYKYKIFIGGNMLERGITIKNLSVTYIYRTAKVNAVDTTLQRARWFGYKESYIDLCKVYMPKELINQFIDINDHENSLWDSISSFLESGEPIQKMSRIFELNNPSLKMTRNTVSKTKRISELNSGYKYDKGILYEDENKISENISLIEKYFTDNESKIKKYFYGRNNEHCHLYIEVKFSDFYDKVIKKYNFPKNANKLSHLFFSSLLKSIENKEIKDSVAIVKMRHGENQFRNPIASNSAIKELPQSYDNGTKYKGDKAVLKDMLNIQIHYVYIDEKNPNKIIPMLAVNNPNNITKYVSVTGSNYYENKH